MKLKKILFVFLVLVIVSACAPADNEAEVVSYLEVPNYATGKAIVEAVFQSIGVSDRNYAVKYTAKDETDEQLLGLVAVLVPYSELNEFSDKEFTDFGQTCKVSPSHTYELSDGVLVVGYSASTGIDSFEKFCDSQIPDTIDSYYVTLSTGDDDKNDTNLVIWEISGLPVIAKFIK